MSRRRAFRGAAGAALLVLAGARCNPFKSTPLAPVELYRVQAAVTHTPGAESGGTASAAGLPAGSVAVQPYMTAGVYDGEEIVYRVGERRYGSYPSRRWAFPLGEMLGRLTSDVLEEAPLARGMTVFNPPSLQRQFTYKWRGSIREFEEVDRDQTVLAAVHLEAQLIRVSDDSIVWSGSRKAERAVAQGTSMGAIVETLSALATESVQSMAAEARMAVVAQRGTSPRGQR